MTETYEHKRNRYCHLILDLLIKNASPEMRELTYGQLMAGEKGNLYATDFFPSITVDKIIEALKQEDSFIQDCCELLKFNEHIEIVENTTRKIITKIRFTKTGVIALKTTFYLKENKKITDDNWLRRSTKINNITTPIIAFLTLLVAVLTFINGCNGSEQCKQSQRADKDKENKEQTTSEGQISRPTPHVPLTSSNDTSPKQQKKDSLTKTIHK